MISHEFVAHWEPLYDTDKYPESFYLSYIADARSAEEPEQLRASLLALLHWKDGKAGIYVPGKDQAKPNMVKPIIALSGDGLSRFARSFRALVSADENTATSCAENLRVLLNGMWSTVVVPALILHLARPNRFPIIDQHTVRAYLALTKGEVVKDPRVTWALWYEYVEFFQNAVTACGFAYDERQRRRVDRALFAWGKSLKKAGKAEATVQPPFLPPESPPSEAGSEGNRPAFWGQPVPEKHIVPTNCNVLEALKEYVNTPSFDRLAPYKQQALRDLRLNERPLKFLIALLENSGGDQATKLLEYYREELRGKESLSNLPRPVRDVFLVGWARMLGLRRWSEMPTMSNNSVLGAPRPPQEPSSMLEGPRVGSLVSLMQKGCPLDYSMNTSAFDKQGVEVKDCAILGNASPDP